MMTVNMMRSTTAAERAAYWATGEPADKAGAYAVQGIAAAFISRLEGQKITEMASE